MKNMFIYYFIVIFIVNSTLPVTPEMIIDKGVSSSINSLLIAAFSLAVFIFSPYWGKYINNHGVKKLCLYLPLAIAITQIMMFIAPGSLGLLGSKFLTGAFTGAVFLMGSIYVNVMSEQKDKAKNFGLLMVVSSLAMALAQIVIGVMSQYFDGYAYAFLIQLILSIIVMPISILLVKEIPLSEETKMTDKVKFRFSPVIIMVILLTAALGIFTVNIGYYMVLEFGITTSQVGYINGLAYFVTMLANMFLIQIFAKHFTFRKSISVQIIIAIASMLLLILFMITLNVFIFIILFIIFVASLSIFRPIAQQKIVADDPANANVNLGFISGSISIGFTLGCLVGGIVFAFNPNLMFVTIIIMLIVSLAIHLQTTKDKI